MSAVRSAVPRTVLSFVCFTLNYLPSRVLCLSAVFVPLCVSTVLCTFVYVPCYSVGVPVCCYRFVSVRVVSLLLRLCEYVLFCLCACGFFVGISYLFCMFAVSCVSCVLCDVEIASVMFVDCARCISLVLSQLSCV